MPPPKFPHNVFEQGRTAEERDRDERHWKPEDPKRSWEPGWEPPPYKRKGQTSEESHNPMDWSPGWTGGYRSRTLDRFWYGQWKKDWPEGKNPLTDNPIISEDPANPPGGLRGSGEEKEKGLWEHKLQHPKLPGASLGSMEQYRLETIEMTDLGQNAEWAQEMQKLVAEDKLHEHHTANEAGMGGGAAPEYGGHRRRGGRGNVGGDGGGDSSGYGGEYSGTAAADGSAYMKTQRAKQAEELKDPKVRAEVIGLISHEQTGERNRSMVLEAMSNRARMRGHTLSQEMHSGFYGPVGPGPRGKHTGAVPTNVTAADKAIGEAAIRRLIGGQNLLESTTDQGSKNDPNFAKYMHDPSRYHTMYTTGKNWKKGAEQFADINPSWGAKDRAAQAAYDRSHVSGQYAARHIAGGGPGIGRGDSGPAAGGTSVGGHRQRMGGASLARVDPRLQEIMEAAATHMPHGYRVQATSGYRPHQHYGFHPKGMAADYQIIGPRGAIPNRGGDPTGMYTRLARAAKGEQQSRYPDLTGRFAWGGAFGTVPGGKTSDLMHFDIGGERGHIANRMLRNMSPLPNEKYGRRGE